MIELIYNSIIHKINKNCYASCMKKKIKLFLRDVLLLIVFFLLVGIVIRKSSKFIKIHKKSIIHELDNVLIQQSETLQEICQKLKRFFADRMQQKDNNTIDQLYKKIAELEEVYKKNSNALIFLGPIGTVSIILKERQVKSDLLTIVRQLVAIANNYVIDQKKHTQEITSIYEGIGILQQLVLQ